MTGPLVERDWIALLSCYKAGFPLDEIFREERHFSYLVTFQAELTTKIYIHAKEHNSAREIPPSVMCLQCKNGLKCYVI